MDSSQACEPLRARAIASLSVVDISSVTGIAEEKVDSLRFNTHDLLTHRLPDRALHQEHYWSTFLDKITDCLACYSRLQKSNWREKEGVDLAIPMRPLWLLP